MGGIEASRGFLYQGFASVLKALTDKNKWDKIYVELPTSNDKVDIGLEHEGRIINSIQVKSTINTFSKGEIIRWLTELIKDIESPKYEVLLIGQCTQNAIVFIESIRKYYAQMLDLKAQKSLKEFDTKLLDDNEIEFTILPFDREVLEKIVRDSLHCYISKGSQKMTFDQIKFIASATVNDQMISSTHGQGIDRNKFEEELEKRIYMVADKYEPKRISIGVKSFSRGTEHLEKETERCLSLIDKFNGRKLKDEWDWNQDIYRVLNEFLLASTNKEQAFQMFLDTHASIAFAVGRTLDSKSGINIFPVQKSATDGSVLWKVHPTCKRSYPNWNISNEECIKNQCDSALFLNITRNIYDDAMMYIREKNLPIGRIINCTPTENGATNFAIEDGTHATILANSVYAALSQRNLAERRATLHIFAAAPNAFMFFLGQNSAGFGKCILYEYDFEQKDSCTYSPSIDFTK